MYSLNVPLPRAVHDLADSLRPALTGFERIRHRGSRTLVVKRLEASDRRAYLDAERRARAALAGAPPFEARIAGIGAFTDPPNGTGPVAYLTVESTGLRALHDGLVESLDARPALEGRAYTPHVTLARDGDARAVETIRGRSFEPVTWQVDALEFYDARHDERIDRVGLPA
ncbi:MAG: 2'-5' RNA ligase family protein [Halanaeroarchaeum sp.]